MARTRSNIQSLNCGSIKVTDGLTVGGTTDFGTVTWTGAQTFNGGLTVTSLTTHSGKFVLSNADVPTTFTAAGTAGQIVLRPSAGMLYICMSTNSWYQVALSNTTAFN